MSTAIAPSKPGPSTLNQFLGQENVRRQLQMALPKHMTVDRLVRVALTAAIRTPLLYECTTSSLALCLLNCAQLGLEPNGRDAHLIPFKNKKRNIVECQLIPDYKGLIQLTYRSGMIDNLTAKAVYERDIFVYEFGTDEHLKHVPCTEDDPGQLVFAWAMVRFKNGGSKFVVLNSRDIAQRKAKSQTANSPYENVREQSIWNTHPEAMWAKSAVKELSKWIPQTPELQDFHKAVEIDTAADMGSPIIDASSQAAEEDQQLSASKSEQLAAKLGGKADKPAEEPAATPPNVTIGLSEDDKVTLDQWREFLAGTSALKEIADAEAALPSSTPQLLVGKIRELCEMRRAEIRGSRGARSNG